MDTSPLVAMAELISEQILLEWVKHIANVRFSNRLARGDSTLDVPTSYRLRRFMPVLAVE
jgi:hypothetical protein